MTEKSKTPHVLVGVSGGIAAYKTPQLVRLLSRDCSVRVCLTNSARKFVGEIALQAVSGNPVVCDMFAPHNRDGMDHIEIARWAEYIIIAPASANCIARLAHGLADDLLAAICLASEAKKILAPAMNAVMFSQAVTQRNLQTLQGYGWHVLPVDSGEQACGEYGAGRMLEPQQIADAIHQLQYDGKQMAGKKVLISAGPTREAIDPVRYISNRSSGKMGYAIATAALQAGAEVTLVSGAVDIPPPPCRLISVESAAEMYDQVLEAFENCDIFIACAAVADYSPLFYSDKKIKKESDSMQLQFKKTKDIVADCAARKNHQLVIGFAAETDAVLDNARKKRSKKKLDMVIVNDVGKKGIGFDSDENEVALISDSGEKKLPRNSKQQLAHAIIAHIATL